MIYTNGKPDFAAQWELDKSHALNPRIGDYWQEMLTPICVVVGRPSTDTVLICKGKRAVGADSWTWDLSKLEKMSITDFSEFLHYKSPEMKGKFWCHCLPEKHTWVRAAAIEELFGENKDGQG